MLNIKKQMTKIETLKNNLINQILASKNEELLQAINDILHTTKPEEITSLSLEHIEMLNMSEKDILNGNLISESELNNLDSKWMN